MSIFEYNEEEALKYIREDEREEGREEGRKEGREEGRKEGQEEGRKEGQEEGRKEGHEEGRKEGLTKGKTCILIELVCKKHAKGKGLSEIAAELEESTNDIQPIYEIVQKCAPLYEIEEIYEKYKEISSTNI